MKKKRKKKNGGVSLSVQDTV